RRAFNRSLPRAPLNNIPSMSEGRAHQAFEEYISNKCCYSSAPVREGVITNMESFNTYRYRLETFTESRSTKWSEEPYTGQHVDAGIQCPPGPWEIAAQPPSYFTDHKETIRVPYTSSVKDIITDNNDLYSVFTRGVASRCVNKTMSAFVFEETTNNKRYSTPAVLNSSPRTPQLCTFVCLSF
uniref:Uncharacterized protein n=1 Tax=Cyprinus carpio TaxID=7962 RepID=A0A8C1NYQ6_CYPCA